MRLIDLAAGYVVIGLVCAVALTIRRQERDDLRGGGGPRRAAGRRILDAIFALFLWPLYVPVLLGADERGRPALGLEPRRSAGAGGPQGVRAQIDREHELLLGALDQMADPTLSRLLPGRERLRQLLAHLERLDDKVGELGVVLAREEFDPARAERAVQKAETSGYGLSSAKLARESIQRLQALATRAARERDELIGLCTRLRMQVTVLRFSGDASGDVDGDLGELVAEIDGRIEGVGATLEPIPGAG